MKLWNNYVKEMKIAARGFYFYTELFVAFIMLSVLTLVVPTESTSVSEEVLFANMSTAQFDATILAYDEAGNYEQAEDAVFTVKPTTLTYTDTETSEETTLTFEDKKDVTASQYYSYDANTGAHTTTHYYVDSFEDMLRIAYSEKHVGAEIYYDENGLDCYTVVLFGYETQRYQNILLATHGTVDTTALLTEMELAEENTITLAAVETLNNRENFIPVVLVMLNAMLGMMVIVAYISVDKSEGIIKALCVAPSGIVNYLTSKTLVVISIVLISSSIITLPVMGGQPNYPLFYLVTVCMSLLSCGLGVLISTFFKDLKSAFGAIMLFCIFMMLPMITYFMPSFHPAWMDALPTYYMLIGLKETLLAAPDTFFVLGCAGGMVFASAVLYTIAFGRYKKTLMP